MAIEHGSAVQQPVGSVYGLEMKRVWSILSGHGGESERKGRDGEGVELAGLDTPLLANPFERPADSGARRPLVGCETGETQRPLDRISPHCRLL